MRSRFVCGRTSSGFCSVSRLYCKWSFVGLDAFYECAHIPTHILKGVRCERWAPRHPVEIRRDRERERGRSGNTIFHSPAIVINFKLARLDCMLKQFIPTVLIAGFEIPKNKNWKIGKMFWNPRVPTQRKANQTRHTHFQYLIPTTMATNPTAVEVEETIARIRSHKGVEGVVIMTKEG